MTPATVLIVSNHGNIVGGGEISLLLLLEGLDRTQWRPVVAVPAEGPVADRCRALQAPAHVIPLPGIRRCGGGVIHAVLSLKRLADATGARLLHANGSRAMFYAGLAGLLAGRPVLWHVRVADRDPLLDPLLAALATRIVVNSRAVAGRFHGAAARRVRCVHNGVNLKEFSPRQPRPGLREALGVSGQGPVIASAGRFVAYKGYAHLIEAARLLKADRPDVEWIIAGDGELRGVLEEQCRRHGLAGQVHFLGWRDDLPDVLALADIFVSPAIGEHFGRVLIEAMAMGKPVVATASGAVPEIVADGKTGLLVPPADPTALAGALRILLADPDARRRLGEAGRTRVEAEFSLARHAEAIGAVYRECTGEAHGRV
ncbi:MAG: glycosyltransferase family 4 protein [Armatimonadota bacterium]|nr:glycosyltransferase family 4 protein [Armatimonadota bacterium]